MDSVRDPLPTQNRAFDKICIMLDDAYHTIKNYFDALVARDAQRLIEMMSSADYYVKIGTDMGEIVRGGENAIDDYYQHHVASTEDFTLQIKHLDVQERDSVAWFYTTQIWRLKWQGVFEEFVMRMTGVLEKENGKWRFVQIHGSIGVPTDFDVVSPTPEVKF